MIHIGNVVTGMTHALIGICDFFWIIGNIVPKQKHCIKRSKTHEY